MVGIISGFQAGIPCRGSQAAPHSHTPRRCGGKAGRYTFHIRKPLTRRVEPGVFLCETCSGALGRGVSAGPPTLNNPAYGRHQLVVLGGLAEERLPKLSGRL